MNSLYLTNILIHNPLRYGILVLLVINFSFFVSSEMTFRAIDAMAWLIILVFIEWKKYDSIINPIIWWRLVVQWAALGMISLSCSMSLLQEDWVSLANEATWLCVLLLPNHIYHRYTFLKSLLYISLVGYCAYWGMNQSFMDCYDSILWIAAFLQLEYENKESSLLNDAALYNEKIICA